MDEVNYGDPKNLYGKIYYARLKKSFDKKYKRFYFSVHIYINLIFDIIMISYIKIGGQEKYGMAPCSGLKKEIQLKLD